MISALSYKIIKPNHKFLIIALIFFGFKIPLFSQGNIKFDFNGIELKPALQRLIEDHNVSIVFPDSIPNTSITAKCNGCNTDEAVSIVLSSTNLTWEKSNSQYIVLLPQTEPYFIISGRVVDQLTNEPIPYSNIFIPSISLGDISNHDGIFSISNIYVATCSLIVSYIGYESRKIGLSFPNDDRKNYEIALIPKILSSEEISIFGTPKEFMDRSNNPGQVSFSPRHISTLPNLGEVDIFRSLQFLPGVQLGLGETSGLYIRGGSPDQNLVLLDWMPIYQTGHMFGFVSGISANAIKDIQVYKGSIPSKYGGRISSVIDLSCRSGNSMDPHGSLYGNLMSQGASAEIPIFKRGSYIVNYRSSNPSNRYSTLYTSIQKYVTGDDRFNLLTESASEENDQDAYYDIWSSYQDIIGRISLLISPDHRLTITHIDGVDSVLEDRGYFGFNSILGSDDVLIEESNNIKNKGIVMNCYSNWSPDYNSHFSLSRYNIKNSSLSLQSPKMSTDTYPLINEVSTTNEFFDRSIRFHQQYKGIKDHSISTGLQETYFELIYKSINKDGTSNNSSFFKQNTFSHSFFLEDEWRPFTYLEIRSGIRILYYDMVDNKFYQEPRLAIKYKMYRKLSLEASIGKHHQFVHHLTNRSTIQNNWLLSSDVIPITTSLNKHLGINWDDLKYIISLSAYKRSMNDLFRFEDFPTIFEYSVNSKIILGSGEKNGIEFIIRKKNGAIRGWVSYHFNQTEYKFPYFNNGQSFLANHDKSHELKTVAIARIWNIDITANWVFSSGGLYTDINNMYVEPGSGYEINTTGNFNEKRLPPIHHLDIGISKSWKISPVVIDVGFSIYNIYNKNNVSHKRYNPYTSQLSISNISMFGMTPSINIKISF